METKLSTEYQWKQGNVTLVADRYDHDKGYLRVCGHGWDEWVLEVDALDVDDVIDVLVEWRKLS
jgi:hypothetical protein